MQRQNESAQRRKRAYTKRGAAADRFQSQQRLQALRARFDSRAQAHVTPAKGQARNAHLSFVDKLRSVPARFMQPRILFVTAVTILTAVGILMVFSASSIVALTNSVQGNNPAFYLLRQLIFLAIAILFAYIISRVDYHLLLFQFLPAIACIVFGLLLMIFIPAIGHGSGGASRWISIAGFTLQPSEFAKFVLILIFVRLTVDYAYKKYNVHSYVKQLVAFIGIPMLFILVQPDKGTTLVLCCTFIITALYAGISGRSCLMLIIGGLLAFIGLSLKDEYSRLRLLGMLDPWKSPDKFGYQLIQGFYAFAHGGLFGVGVGMGKQKYGYLPMAYNDFIFSVIGEELGLVGALVVLCCFGLIMYAGLKIAEHAPDLHGQLIVIACTFLFAIQTLLNITGVLGLFPLSGKPIPFVSYGGSSIISSFMLVGLVLSVSRASHLPTTAHDRARADLSLAPNFLVAGAQDASGEQQRAQQLPYRQKFGHKNTHDEHMHITTNARGFRRISVAPSARERLRNDSSRRSDRRGR